MEVLTITRQKKEIIKKIQAISDFIEVDVELGCGFSPPGAYDELYKEMDRLENELARLQHFTSSEQQFLSDLARPNTVTDAPNSAYSSISGDDAQKFSNIGMNM